MPRKKKAQPLEMIEETPREYTLTVQDKEIEDLLRNRFNELPNLINEFKENALKIKYDKFGNEVNDTNPYLVSTYFFKPINPQPNVEPIYTSNQLTKVYTIYNRIVEQINLKIMTFQPTLSHFAKFAGMSLKALSDLRYSEDTSMRVLIERIYSDTFDANVTLSQHYKLEKTTTAMRMKVENEAIEKKTPDIKVSVTTKPIDLEQINNRVAELQLLAKKGEAYADDYD